MCRMGTSGQACRNEREISITRCEVLIKQIRPFAIENDSLNAAKLRHNPIFASFDRKVRLTAISQLARTTIDRRCGHEASV